MPRFTSEVSVLVKLTFETDTEPTDNQLVEAGIALQDRVQLGIGRHTREYASSFAPGAQNVQCTVHFDDHDINVDEYPGEEG